MTKEKALERVREEIEQLHESVEAVKDKVYLVGDVWGEEALLDLADSLSRYGQKIWELTEER